MNREQIVKIMGLIQQQNYHIAKLTEISDRLSIKVGTLEKEVKVLTIWAAEISGVPIVN